MKGFNATQMALAFVRAPLLLKFIRFTLISPILTRRENESLWMHRWRCMLEARLYFEMLYEFARHRPKSVIILDQWISRKLNITTNDGRAAEILRFISDWKAYFNHHYIFIDMPFETWTDRALRRTPHRISRYGDYFPDMKSAHQYYEKRCARYQRMYVLFKRPGMSLLRLDGERSPEENAQLVIDRLVHPYVRSCEDESPASTGPGMRNVAMVKDDG